MEKIGACKMEAASRRSCRCGGRGGGQVGGGRWEGAFEGEGGGGAGGSEALIACGPQGR